MSRIVTGIRITLHLLKRFSIILPDIPSITKLFGRFSANARFIYATRNFTYQINMINKRREALRRYFKKIDPDEHVIFELSPSSSWPKDFFDIVLAYLLLSAIILALLFVILKVFCFFKASPTGQGVCMDLFWSDIYIILIPLAFLVLILLTDSLFSIIRRKLILTNKRLLAYNGSLLLEKKLTLDLQEVQSLTFTKSGIIYQKVGSPTKGLLVKWPSKKDAVRFISEFNLLVHA